MRKKSKIWKNDSSIWRTVFDVARKREKIRDLEKEFEKPDFWENKERAAKISQELENLKGEIKGFDDFEEELESRNTKEPKRQSRDIIESNKSLSGESGDSSESSELNEDGELIFAESSLCCVY